MKQTSLSGWQFLDLKNKKQTGDLDKKILQYKQKQNCTVFNFTSSNRGEGVSTIIANLIHYVKTKKSDNKILIIDTNFNSPGLNSIFKIKGNGLADILDGTAVLSDIVQEIGSDNLHLLTCGKNHTNMVGNIDQEKLGLIVAEAKEIYDFIIIDSSPILTSSDSITTASVSDITFLVLRAHKVHKDVALKAKLLLIDNECVVGGVILNRTLQVIPSWVYKLF